ncbi:MAG: hypothetical protein KDI29_14805, partial [Pseudomonadales bacterium]|nr:hypothetical protein [Pseudomonadales bacterium]
LGLYPPAKPGSMNHLCIGVNDYEPEAMVEKLLGQGIEVHINRNPANRTSGNDQRYLKHPDGITVQLVQHGYLGPAGLK